MSRCSEPVALVSDTRIAQLPTIRIGNPAPPRLTAMLLVDTLSRGTRGEPPEVPRVAFRCPSGSLTTTIRRPDGEVHVIGPAHDFKFLFGGAVLRGSLIGEPRYAGYASLFVLIPNGDPAGTRVFPPFRGNGGAKWQSRNVTCSAAEFHPSHRRC